MSVVSGLNKVEVSREAEKMIKKSATVITDGRRCYAGLQDICRVHEVILVKDKTEVSKVFPGYIPLSAMLKRNYWGCTTM